MSTCWVSRAAAVRAENIFFSFAVPGGGHSLRLVFVREKMRHSDSYEYAGAQSTQRRRLLVGHLRELELDPAKKIEPTRVHLWIDDLDCRVAKLCD